MEERLAANSHFLLRSKLPRMAEYLPRPGSDLINQPGQDIAPELSTDHSASESLLRISCSNCFAAQLIRKISERFFG
jgi:hypothetical protein